MWTSHIAMFCLIPVLIFANSDRIQQFYIYGNTRTKPQAILREFQSCVNAPLGYEQLHHDLLYLKRLNFVNRIDIRIKPGNRADQKNILLIIKEKPRMAITPLLNWDDMNGIYGGAALEFPNLFGNREHLTLGMNVGGIQQVGLRYHMPNLGDQLRFFLTTDILHRRFHYKYPDFRPHNQNRTAVEIQLGHHPVRELQYGLFLQTAWLSTSLPDAVLERDGDENLFVISGFIHLDSRDWPVYPQTGRQIHLQAGKKFFGNAGQSPFVHLNCNHYHRLMRDHIIALQIHAQYHWQHLPVYERLHFGGSNTIRGIEAGSMWGNKCWLTTLEYRFPVFMQRNPLGGIHFGWAGVLFVDTGSIWQQSGIWDEARWAVGCGAHAIWDRWIIRLEYANNGDDWGYITAGSGVKF